MKKLRGLTAKVFTSILSCALVTLVILGGVSIHNSSGALEESAIETLTWTARYHAAEFSREMGVLETQIGTLADHVIDALDTAQLEDKAARAAYMKDLLTPYIMDFANHTTGKSAWVYMDSGWGGSEMRISFADQDNDGTSEAQAVYDDSYFTQEPTQTDDKYWWLGPKTEGRGVWTNPHLRTLGDGSTKYQISYSLPIMLDGEFLGVAGGCYSFSGLMDAVSEIRVMDSGYAALYNEKFDVISHPNFNSGTRISSENLTTLENGSLADMYGAFQNSDYGVAKYHLFNEERVAAFCKLDNGWIFTLNPDVMDLYRPVYKIIGILLAAGVLCILLAVIWSWKAGLRIVRPILALAEDAKIFGTGDLSHHVKITTEDELAVLGESLNSMARNVSVLQKAMERLAYYDPLTGIRNLSKFKIDGVKMVKSHQELKYVVVKLDVEQFKVFNELCGFTEGDRMIRYIANELSRMLDDSCELVCRVGSDEFALLLAYKTLESVDHRRQTFEKSLEDFSRELNIRVTCPTGRYFMEPGEFDMTQAYENVNLAHRLAKQRPAPKILDYDQKVKEIANQERQIEQHQETALLMGEFKLFLQPKYRLSDETIVGAEGLIRWNSPKMGMVYPNSFIPLFERNGFVTKIDMWMLEQVCKTLREWLDRGIEPVNISVNFSRLHLGNPNFLNEICHIADSNNVPRSLLEVELTETVLFDHGDLLVSFLRDLHDAGFRFSMDDFGSGYSSLGLLKNLPVDVVKLDRSFFVDAIDVKRERTVITSVIEMAKKLEISTVAEGVEDKAQIDFLKELGCDIVQGYYYAKPMPVADFNRRMDEERSKVKA